jgi:hypothetical protein
MTGVGQFRRCRDWIYIGDEFRIESRAAGQAHLSGTNGPDEYRARPPLSLTPRQKLVSNKYQQQQWQIDTVSRQRSQTVISPLVAVSHSFFRRSPNSETIILVTCVISADNQAFVLSQQKTTTGKLFICEAVVNLPTLFVT